MSVIAESLKHLVNGIVDEPEAVRVSEKNLCCDKLLEAHIAPTDLGRVIGRNGRIAKALRCVVTALSTNGSVRVDAIDQERH